MLKPGDITIINGARTPMGRYGGKLRDFTAQDLAAVASKGAMERAGVDAKEFDHAVFGNAQQTSGDALYGARHVALKAGLPIETPALTVNRLCGSGMQAIVSAAQMIQLGEANVVLAGGMESMSQAPHVIRGARWGFGLGEGKLEDSLMVALLDTYCGLYMANTAELYGEQQGITRQMQDEFALRSQRCAEVAYKAGRLQEELVPVPLKDRRGESDRGDVQGRRSPSSTNHYGRIGQAEARVWQERNGHCRQCQRNRRWWRGRGHDVVG
jgi:acetyl-CoA acetyltransferase family protein